AILIRLIFKKSGNPISLCYSRHYQAKSKDMTKLRKLLFVILLAAVLAGPMATPAGAIPGTQNSAHRSHTTNSRRKVHVRSHRKKSGPAVRAHKPAISQPK